MVMVQTPVKCNETAAGGSKAGLTGYRADGQLRSGRRQVWSAATSMPGLLRQRYEPLSAAHPVGSMQQTPTQSTQQGACPHDISAVWYTMNK